MKHYFIRNGNGLFFSYVTRDTWKFGSRRDDIWHFTDKEDARAIKRILLIDGDIVEATR